MLGFVAASLLVTVYLPDFAFLLLLFTSSFLFLLVFLLFLVIVLLLLLFFPAPELFVYDSI